MKNSQMNDRDSAMGSVLIAGAVGLSVGFLLLGFVKGIGLSIVLMLLAGWWYSR